ncbi:MAG TPA: 23S rRNA (uracil(1939)-C(5))-methyltransferase RlmD, partial [Bacillota bacterium]|nr:23S rRNA (uracil(1939)-C(5))-methyltransferase RlmD [Bacillota bacterium]
MNRLKTKQQDQVLLKPGQEILLTIKRMGINGEGIGYYKKKAVFVPGAIVGEVVEVKIIKVERGYAEGSVKKIKTASPMRQTPSCPVYEQCGGCQLQHLTYEGQLKAKEEIFRGAFDRYTTIKDLPIRPILGMDEPWAYRNKAQLQVGMHDGKMVTGLYSPSSHRLVDVSGCPVQHPQTNQIIDITRQVLEKFGISVYDEKKRTGVIRTIIARIGFESGEQQLILVTATKDLAHRAEIVSELRSRLPDLSSISQNVNPKKTSLIFGDQTIHLWGSAHITEKLEQTSYSLSPRT